MAEGRMLKKKVSQSRKVNSLSLKTALVWTWAIPWFDGYGFIEAESDFLKLNVVPRREDISEADMPGVLRELSRSGLWIIYKDKETGKLIAYDPKFKEEQKLRIDREGKQKFTPGVLQDYSGSTPAEDKINEVKISKEEARTPVDKLSEDEKKELNIYCVKIRRKFESKFNPYAWIQKNISLNPKTQLHVMRRLATEEEILNPWPYADKIASIENGNYNEDEEIRAHEERKKDTPSSIGECLKGAFNGMPKKI